MAGETEGEGGAGLFPRGFLFFPLSCAGCDWFSLGTFSAAEAGLAVVAETGEGEGAVSFFEGSGVALFAGCPAFLSRRCCIFCSRPV